MSDTVYNFGAGPAMLPAEVMKQAQEELLNFNGTGISVMETSHRAKSFAEVIDTAEADLRSLMGISDEYDVLFLQGGASHQFAMIPANILGANETADYIDTGVWSKKAIKEGQFYGTVHVAGTSKDRNYAYIPTADQLAYSANPVYTHYTSNNTIFGTQFHELPTGNAPLVADMSSDIMCRPVDVNAHGIIYAGAQKNIGPSGLALVVIKKEWVEKAARELPTIMQYKTHADNASLFNTPPTFAIYIVGLVAKWLKNLGGLEAMQKLNEEKAAVLYNAIDNSNGYYRGVADTSARSLMNVTYRLPSEELEATFVSEATAAGLIALKGHRNAGGIRASIYNAMPKAGVEALANFMADFAKNNG